MNPSLSLITVGYFCCLFPKGVSDQRWITSPICGSDCSSAHPADYVWLGTLLDISQPLQEPLCAQPTLPRLPVSLSVYMYIYVYMYICVCVCACIYTSRHPNIYQRKK